MKHHLSELFAQALKEIAPEHAATAFEITRSKQVQHGDFACNLAMQLARPLRGNPREIATKLLSALPASPFVEKTEIAGAGFINLFLTPNAKQQVIKQS